MPGLKKKMEDYFKIAKYSMQYELASGTQLRFTFEKTAFLHLTGIYKLIDIPLIQKYNDSQNLMVNAKYLLTKIRQGKLTEADIRTSKHFAAIEDRYERLTSDNLLSMTYTDVVIDFDVTLLKASKLVNTKYILFEKEQNAYRQLCIKQNNMDQLYYVETFFYEKSDDYIRGQLRDRVISMQVIAPDGSIYLEDSF